MHEEDKTYENENRAETTQLKNIIDSKEAEITTLKNIIDELKLKKVKEIEEVKKEADKLMMEKIIKYKKLIRKLKRETKDMLQYP